MTPYSTGVVSTALVTVPTSMELKLENLMEVSSGLILGKVSGKIGNLQLYSVK